ncbi:MAG: hypothetical protein PHS57_09605 [Alphaproteobacteria bacterium]|nr:hypothetical protein [Alphaproteobacteria bacterium]
MLDIPPALSSIFSSTDGASRLEREVFISFPLPTMSKALEATGPSTGASVEVLPLFVSKAGHVTLSVPGAGPLSLPLPQELNPTTREAVIQQLEAFVREQKPLMMTVQKNDASLTGLLTVSIPSVTERVARGTDGTSSFLPRPSLRVGDTLRAVVFMPEIGNEALFEDALQSSKLRGVSEALDQQAVVRPFLSNGVVSLISETFLEKTEQGVGRAALGQGGAGRGQSVRSFSAQPSNLTPSVDEANVMVNKTSLASGGSVKINTEAVSKSIGKLETILQGLSSIADDAVPNNSLLAEKIGSEQAARAPSSSLSSELLKKTQALSEKETVPPSLLKDGKVDVTRSMVKAPFFGTARYAAETTPGVLSSFPSVSSSSPKLSPGQDVALKILSILPSSDLQSLPEQIRNVSNNPEAAVQPMLAVVREAGMGGSRLVLDVDGSMAFLIKTPIEALPGTALLVSVDDVGLASWDPVSESKDAAFSSLPAALSVLAQSEAPLFHNALLQPTQALSASLLFFLSAVKQGKLSGWLGPEAVEALRGDGQDELLHLLSKDMTGRAAQDSIVGDWRMYTLPLYAHPHFQNLTLYVHPTSWQQGKRGRPNEDKGGLRFLIDMTLSRLGAMQLDGFVRGKALHMILRSEKALPSGLHQTLRASYLNVLEGVGCAGTLTFQVGRQHWMIMKPSRSSDILA